MTAPTDTDYENAASSADQLATKIRSWKAGPPTPSPTPIPPPIPSPDPKKWKLDVDDEFTAAKLDLSIWWAPYDGVPGTAGAWAPARDRSRPSGTVS